MHIRDNMILSSVAGGAVGWSVGALAGLALALTGHDILGSILGGTFGGAACGAFLGGTAPLAVAKVREHLNKPQTYENAENYQAEL